jgi:hypothetical protein
MRKVLKYGSIAIGAIIAIILVVALVGSVRHSESTPPTPIKPSTTHSTPKEVTPPPTPDAGTQPPIQDGDWKLTTVTVQNDGLGDFGGVSRVTYTGDSHNASNTFVLTIFKHGKVVATLDGSADGVEPGQSVTVEWVSSDPYVSGPYTFDFQNDF